jgi:extracellular factor (EF) 3-hydroxypalmitic acid methyl ester biosynthesis protein
MVFLPFYIPRSDASAAMGAAADLLNEVRAVATDLVANLNEAERLTAGWSNECLADALVDAALSESLVRLAATNCWGEANRLPSSELWRIAGPVLEAGSLQHHARFKPHGYAGDHEMLSRICEQSCSTHPLGRFFDRYFLRQAAPEAVRARTEQIATALLAHCLQRPREQYRVVSVGSGPALDVWRAVRVLPRNRLDSIRVRLLDLDPNALDAARSRLAPFLPAESLDCLRTNLFRLAQGSRGAKELQTPDFLICSGLFDYLEDEAASALLDLFWRQLAEGGTALVGNFAPHNPSRAYMEWIGNWYLKYRTVEDMEKLGVAAGIPRRHFSIGCERIGVDLFLVARK